MLPSSRYSISQDEISVVELPPPLMGKIHEEDEKQPLPYRFAVNLKTDISPGTAGTWTDLPDGARLWRVTVFVPGALGLSAYFNRYHLSGGSELFLYSEGKTEVLGAFTSQENSKSGYFATELVSGEKMTLEYYQPPEITAYPDLHLFEIAYAYRGVPGEPSSVDGKDRSGACEVNINCPEGETWQKQKKGVARIKVKKAGSSFWCSGSLVNNTLQDKKPYILTAHHCGDYATPDDIQQWIFTFWYETTSCKNGTYAKSRDYVGGTLKAKSGTPTDLGSDFFLVLMNNLIPDSLDVVYNGWNRKDTTSPQGVGIHHPYGDVKKISTYTSSLVQSDLNGDPGETHWKVYWTETQNGHGVTEGGSSGSPLFDFRGRITGTLTGGASNCDSIHLFAPDYYGKFSYHWDRNGTDSATCLKYWLDPAGMEPFYLDGLISKPGPQPYVKPTLKIGPVPFTHEEVLRFYLTGTWPDEVTISFEDVTGREVLKTTVANTNNEIFFSGAQNLPVGLYVIKVSIPGQMFKKKVIKY